MVYRQKLDSLIPFSIIGKVQIVIVGLDSLIPFSIIGKVQIVIVGVMCGLIGRTVND